MSYARLALRLAALEALCPHDALTTGYYPTSAGNQVYDTRFDPIAAAQSDAEAEAILTKIEGSPLIAVYTDIQSSTPYGTSFRPEKNIVTLVIEAIIAAKGTMTVENPDGTSSTIGTLDAPLTDAQHEAALDHLEACIRRVFNRKIALPSSTLFFQVAMRTEEIHADPQRDARTSVRLAQRFIKYQVQVPDDGDWTADATGLAVLPSPLNIVAANLNPASSGGQICAALAAKTPIPLAALNPAQIAVYVNVNRVPAPTSAAYDLQAASPSEESS